MADQRDLSRGAAPIRPASAPEKPRGSKLPLLLVGVACLGILVAVGFIYPGIPLIVGAIAGFALVHYLAWGWWLPRVIRKQVDADERDEAAANGGE